VAKAAAANVHAWLVVDDSNCSVALFLACIVPCIALCCVYFVCLFPVLRVVMSFGTSCQETLPGQISEVDAKTSMLVQCFGQAGDKKVSRSNRFILVLVKYLSDILWGDVVA
jgi:hypothetical protein